MPDPLQNLTPAELDAARELIASCGCLPDRAVTLVETVAQVGAQEALEVIAGTATVSAGITDIRVARLRSLIAALPPDSAFPNPYELGAVFRITPSQSASLIRTYQARHSADYQNRMDRQVKGATAVPRVEGKKQVWRIQFDDPVALDYAADRLRRRGISRSVSRDPVELTLTVDRDQKDRHGQNAIEILECQVAN